MTIRKPEVVRKGPVPDVRKFDLNSNEIHRLPALDAETTEDQLSDILDSGLLVIQKLACKGVLSVTEQNYLKVLLQVNQVLNPTEQTKKVEVSVKNQYDDLSTEELIALAQELTPQ